MRVVHVYMHGRLTSAGGSEEEVEQLISGIEQNLAPLIDPMLRRLHGEYLLEAMMEDAFFHLTGGARRAEALGSVEVTIALSTSRPSLLSPRPGATTQPCAYSTGSRRS